MRVLVFGGTGLIGRGVLLQALDNSSVESVLSIGRSEVHLQHAKLRQVIHRDFGDFRSIATELEGVDACFWCLGTASAGMDEPAYTRITFDYTMAAARVLLERSPKVCFCFVSGSGTDANSRMMWARVKGKTENALRDLGLGSLYLFRPGFIQSTRGDDPPGKAARVASSAIFPVLRVFGGATSNGEIGDAMIAAALGLSQKRILNSNDINRLAAESSGHSST